MDLGLVYGVEIAPGRVRVEVTMTSPACPMGEMILGDARQALEETLPEDWDIELSLVWEPPWDPSMMSEKTRGHFGW